MGLDTDEGMELVGCLTIWVLNNMQELQCRSEENTSLSADLQISNAVPPLVHLCLVCEGRFISAHPLSVHSSVLPDFLRVRPRPHEAFNTDAGVQLLVLSLCLSMCTLGCFC